MVTMKDVALAAGVSPATVSNAFRGRTGRLSDSQREHILQVATSLGYLGPNPAGSALRTGVVGALGVMFSESLSFVFDDSSAVTLLKGISHAAERADLSLMLLPFPPHRDDVVDADRDARIVRNSLVDGFIAYSMPDDHPAIRSANSRRLPMVIVDAPFDHDLHYVGIRDRAAARICAEHLLSLGHSNIGILVDRLVPDGHRGHVTPSRLRATTEAVPRERLRGYRDGLRSGGVDWKSVALYEAGGLTIPHFDAGAERLLHDRPDLTAILAVNDELALAVLRVCQRREVAVPQQLSVVGFDDVAAAAAAGITTIHQDFVEKGRIASQILIDHPDTPQKVILPTSLVIRRSTGAPPR
ncbi:substrate-binding domain-containing protein [Mycolicibacterium madagascariense]|nr:substrate-binding domain-containing protein [Mycolicibacterium madagascariense]